ncbi:MAG: RES domain-containing protein [Acidimicrobiia bacterium]
MTLKTVALADGHTYLRLADPLWSDPLDPSFAAERGGRWNPPGSWPTLYLNEDLSTARSRVLELLEDSPVEPEDLDGGFDLVEARLPRSQTAADAVSDSGLTSLGLPVNYPKYRNGRPVGHEACQAVGAAVHEADLRGVRCRSAATPEGLGRELAWFPAGGRSAAKFVERRMFDEWWYQTV